jgi:hypothetical protein
MADIGKDFIILNISGLVSQRNLQIGLLHKRTLLKRKRLPKKKISFELLFCLPRWDGTAKRHHHVEWLEQNIRLDK